jgi:hypothetical protein
VLQEIQEDEWDEALDSRGLTDAYLKCGYLAASSIIESGEARLLLTETSEGGVAFPLLIRAIRGSSSLRDVSSPYGYGGPIGFGNPRWEDFHSAYEEWCRENCVVSTFVRFHPLYGNHRYACRAMSVEEQRRTVGWRIGEGTDLLEQMNKRHRRSVRLASSNHLRIEQRTPDDEDLERFRALYLETMDRVGASSFYLFPDEYWSTIRAKFGQNLLLAEALANGDVVASALLLGSKPWMHYHLGASTVEGRHLRATPLMFFETALKAQQTGFRVFHLGGGVGGLADSLFDFKRRFDEGGVRVAAIGKQIHDPDAYQALAGVDDTSGYFPGYRRPA